MRASSTFRNAANVSAALRERVRRPAFFDRLTVASDLAPLFKASRPSDVL